MSIKFVPATANEYPICPFCKNELTTFKFKVIEDNTGGFINAQTSGNVLCCPHCGSILGIKDF